MVRDQEAVEGGGIEMERVQVRWSESPEICDVKFE